jgi:hypothetical protein
MRMEATPTRKEAKQRVERTEAWGRSRTARQTSTYTQDSPIDSRPRSEAPRHFDISIFDHQRALNRASKHLHVMSNNSLGGSTLIGHELGLARPLPCHVLVLTFHKPQVAVAGGAHTA